MTSLFSDSDECIAATTSTHQLHQFFAPDIPTGLRRVKSAFSAAEGYEFGGGFELPRTTDEDSVCGGCALEVVEEGIFIDA